MAGWFIQVCTETRTHFTSNQWGWGRLAATIKILTLQRVAWHPRICITYQIVVYCWKICTFCSFFFFWAGGELIKLLSQIQFSTAHSQDTSQLRFVKSIGIIGRNQIKNGEHNLRSRTLTQQTSPLGAKLCHRQWRRASGLLTSVKGNKTRQQLPFVFRTRRQQQDAGTASILAAPGK